jgi:putative FmdB family regulatory protein
MPLYEYKCDSCEDVFEVMQKFSDQPLAVHEGGCGGPVHRLLSAPAIQFKGTGWYVTDYARANGGPKKEASEGEKKTESESKTEPAKTETKKSEPVSKPGK